MRRIWYRLFHTVLLRILRNQRLQRGQELHIGNTCPLSDTNVIWAVNHSCRDDFPIASEVIAAHTFVLVGKQKLSIVDRIGFFLNGVVYVDRASRTDRQKAFKKMLLHLNQGFSMWIFPEATWNLTPSKPMLPMYWGVIDLAKQSGCPILPLILEYRENACYAKFGHGIYCGPADDKQTKYEELEEEMATLKWEIWETFPRESRKEIDPEEWEREVRRRLSEVPQVDYEQEKEFIRGAKVIK